MKQLLAIKYSIDPSEEFKIATTPIAGSPYNIAIDILLKKLS